jgi:hypothetical protein
MKDDEEKLERILPNTRHHERHKYPPFYLYPRVWSGSDLHFEIPTSRLVL